MSSQTPSELHARTRNRLLGTIAVLLALAAAHFARPALMPFVTGLLIASLAWPLFHWLESRVPRPAALLATVLMVTTVLLALLGAIGWSAAAVAARVRENPERIQALQRRVSAVAERVGVRSPFTNAEPGGAAAGDRSRNQPPPESASAGSQSQRAPSPGGATSEGSATDGSTFAKRAATVVYSTLGYLALAVAFAALTLSELRRARDRIRRRFSVHDASRLLDTCRELAESMRRYVKVKSITSLITGAATGVVCLLFGIEFAGVWAFLAFLFEYVPTIGSLLSVIPPVAYAFVQFDGFTRPLAALGVLTVTQLFLGNYVDPRIEGRLLSLSPLVVLLAIVFWAWLWGAPGSLLGVPIVVAVTVITRRFASSRWIWALLTEANGDERERSDTQVP